MAIEPDWNVVSAHLMDRARKVLPEGSTDTLASHTAYVLASLAEAIQKGLIANV